MSYRVPLCGRMEEAEVLPEGDTVRMLHGRHVWWDDDAVSMDNITNKGGLRFTGGREGVCWRGAIGYSLSFRIRQARPHTFDRGLEIRLRR